MVRKPILVVEDDVHVLETYKLFLEIEGYEVLTARDGRQALDLLRAEQVLPAVILLDLMMPVMNGWEFLQARRADARLARIPVIAITSARFPDAPGGVVATLLKPVDVPALLRLVSEHARASQAPLPKPPLSRGPSR